MNKDKEKRVLADLALRGENYREALLKTREVFWKKALNVFIIIGVLVLLALLTIGDAGLTLSIESLTELSFWGNIAVKTIILILMSTMGMEFRLPTLINISQTLKITQAKYSTKLKIKDLYFNDWVDRDFNRELKIEAYKYNIKNKLRVLNNRWHCKNEDLALYLSDKPLEEKNKNKYCRKRLELESKLDDAFIEKNIDLMNVKYKRVNSSAFTSNIDGGKLIGSDFKYKNLYLTSTPWKTKTKLVSKGVTKMIITTILLTTMILPDFIELWNNMDLHALQAFIISVAMYYSLAIKQLYNGFKNARKVLYHDYITPLNNRMVILDHYVEYRVKNPITDEQSKINDLINILEKNSLENVQEENEEDYKEHFKDEVFDYTENKE